MELDTLDKKIMQELEIDARQSNAKIARTLKINKAMVNYRIERLKNNEIIEGFQYITNQAALGKLSFGLLIQLQDTSIEEEKKIVNTVRKVKPTAWISSVNGSWDLMIVMIEEDFASFIKELNRLFDVIGNKVKKYNFYVDYEGEISTHKYLYPSFKDASVKYQRGEETIILKEIDLKILQALKENPTSSLLQIAEKLKKTYETIKTRYTYLKSKKILLKCVPRINLVKIGHHEYFLLLNVRPNQKRIDDFFSFCSKSKDITRYARCLGHFDAIVNVHVKNSEELKRVTYTIRKELSDILSSLEIVDSAR